MKKNGLVLAGLLIAGLGLTGCAENNTANSSTQKTENTTVSKTETATDSATQNTEEEVTKPEPLVFLGGTFKKNGDWTIELKLIDGKNCLVDVQCATLKADNDFNLINDSTGTYKIENGVFTANLHAKEGSIFGHKVDARDITVTTTYSEADHLYNAKYSVFGEDGLVEKDIAGEWPFTEPLAGASMPSQYGEITAEIKLLDAAKFILDITTTFPSMNAMFDITGTYKLVDGVFTFNGKTADIPAHGDTPAVPGKPVDPFTLTSTDFQTYEGNYKQVGKDLTLNFDFIGDFIPVPTAE